tara:strand:+ start:65 stop:598 length:534 start_codon:yes stop_codon:yes gene_type:complete
MHTTKSNDELILETSIVFNTLMNEQGYSTDPRKQREVLACLATGCRPNPEKTGPDCYYFENGKWLPAERKSTTFKYCRGAYTGISNKATWEEQFILLEKKIRDMGRHYYDRFDKKSGALVESWWISGEKVYELLLPRVKSDFDNKKALIAAGKTPADPRLSANITWTDIQEHGTQVI